MKKTEVIIILIITFFILARPWDVFALGAPIETVEWSHNFDSKWIIDDERSTIKWEKGFVSLEQEGDKYSSHGVLWTGDIRFRQDIRSLTLTGNHYEPEGTRILLSVRFEDAIKEHSLDWGSEYWPGEPVRKLRLKIFFATTNPDISPMLYDIYLNLELQDRSERGIINRDNRRVSDLKAMRDVVQKFYDDFGRYPVVSIDESDKDSQWRLLENILKSASASYRKNYTRGFRSQPVDVDDRYKYGYLTNNSGFYFLLWTEMEDMSSERIQESWQGEILNVNCSEPVYCVYSKDAEDSIEPLVIRHFEDEDDTEINQFQGVNFIRQENDPRVYLKIAGVRVWLRTPKIFEKAGGIWDEIKAFKSKLETPLLKFIKEKDNSRVYLVTPSGFKRSMLNEQVLASYGKLSEIVTVGKEIINLLPENYLIRAAGDTKVYFLNQKIRRWITTPQVLEKLGFNFLDVVEIDLTELKLYPEGSPIF